MLYSGALPGLRVANIHSWFVPQLHMHPAVTQFGLPELRRASRSLLRAPILKGSGLGTKRCHGDHVRLQTCVGSGAKKIRDASLHLAG